MILKMKIWKNREKSKLPIHTWIYTIVNPNLYIQAWISSCGNPNLCIQAWNSSCGNPEVCIQAWIAFSGNIMVYIQTKNAYFEKSQFFQISDTSGYFKCFGDLADIGIITNNGKRNRKNQYPNF